MNNLIIYPALTVMVFLRRDLGYRIVNPKWLIGVTLVEILISAIFRPHDMANSPNALFLFAILTLILGMGQRFKRWRELNRGFKQHSFYIGTSYFDFPWLPMFLRRNRRIARTVDPIFCIIIGVMIWQYFPALGGWMFFSGVCLAGLEGEVHRKERNQTLDMVDSIVASEIQGETVEEFEEDPTPEQQRPTSGVPSGLGDDIHQNIKRRKPKQRPPQK